MLMFLNLMFLNRIYPNPERQKVFYSQAAYRRTDNINAAYQPSLSTAYQ